MKYLSIIAFCFLLNSYSSQESIQSILSNATDFEKTISEAEQYFNTKHPDKTPAELCEGIFRDGDYVKFRRWQAYWEDRLNPDGTLGDITAFFRENIERSGSGEFDDIEWDNISYNNYMEVQIGMGRTTSIGFHPTDQDIFYVGAAIGGIWKTIDGGQNYTPLGDELPFLAVSQIVVNQEDPDIIYIALSDHLWYGPPGIGIYKSIDGGASWNPTAFTLSFTENTRIYWLEADHSNPDHILAGTSAGLYKTTDGFETVNQINNENTSDVKFHPTDASIVYQGTSSGQFYRSTDGGDNFNLVSSFGGECRIALSSNDPDKVYLRLGAQLKKSTDAGLSFTSGSDLPDNNGILLISPMDDDKLITGSFELYKSEDGGNSYEVLTNWFSGPLPIIHVDHRNAFINPLVDDKVYICNDGGVYSLDVTDDSFENLCDGLMITQFYDIAVAKTDETVIGGGSQDNGNVYRDSFGNWDYYALSGDGMNQEIDPDDESRRYWSYQLGGMQRFSSGFNVSIAPSGQDGNGAWETPYKVDQNNSFNLVCAYDRVYLSENYGNSWVEISPQLSSNNMNQLAIAPSNSNRIYVSRSSSLWVKDLFSNEWEQKNLPGDNISDLEVDPVDYNIVYISIPGFDDGNKVYKSIDAGDSWENISGDLPNVSTGAIETYTVVDGGLFVGTDAGVFYRDNNNPEWQEYGNLPNTRVEDIEIQYSGRKIRIGTHGRGVLEADVTIGLCEEGVNDEDMDGICDEFDLCPDFDDTLLGTPCDDGDDDTYDDVYTFCDLCEGVYFVGIDIIEQDLFSIYPNPSDGIFTINLKHSIGSMLEIYNLSGELVFTEKLMNKSTTVDLNNFSKSMYIVKVIKENGEILSWDKLIIE